MTRTGAAAGVGVAEKTLVPLRRHGVAPGLLPRAVVLRSCAPA